MKKLLYLLILLPSLTFGQVLKETKNVEERPQPEFFINNEKINPEKTYLTPNNIESINVVKKGNGQIFIKLKKNTVLKNLNDIDSNQIDTLKNKIFIIDGKIIKRPSKILIDKDEIGKIEIINSSEIEDLEYKFYIVKITTVTKLKEIEKNKKILIRGS